MQPVSTVGIVAKPGSTQAVSIVPDLLEWFGARHIGVRMDEQTARYAGLSGGCPRDRVADGTQLLIVLGGDGTLLAAARALEGRDIPIFAVNLGALGFRTAITVDEIFPELERALRNEHRIAARRMLQCELMRDGRIVARYDALNDVVLTKASLARMIDLETHVDAHFVATYKADGVIVATPTGSTAYSLSAGGPIIFPAVDALCITPICPHALTARPVLVPGSSNIKMINLSEDSTFLTIDGQIGEPLHHRDTIMCRASAKSVKLIRPPRQKFFDVLRSKLKWGER